MIIKSYQELEHAPFLELGKVECALCDFPLTFPCLFWHTAHGQGLYVHHTCARQWVSGLIQDVHTIDAMLLRQVGRKGAA